MLRQDAQVGARLVAGRVKLQDLSEVTLRGREVSELLRLAEFMLLPEVLWGEGWGYGRRKAEAIRKFAK